jgi:ribose/xylose/arabinose/galactoside ABC-type transport system permease subunit
MIPIFVRSMVTKTATISTIPRARLWRYASTPVIAAVIIGGTSLFGGYGSVVGSVIGAIFIGIVQFGLLTMGFSTSIQEVN